MEYPAVPQFGALLRPHLDAVQPASFPGFLARLERSAAARYRGWAAALPEHEADLRACAQREDEIADIVDALFPIDTEAEAAFAEHLDAAVATYYDVFAPFEPYDQLYLQSEAELQGALAWEHLLARLPAPAAEAAEPGLARCSELERESSVVVKRILDARRLAVSA